MSRFINVLIEDQTTPISQAGFGLGLIFDPDNDFEYAEVMDIDDIPAGASELAENMANQYLSQQPNPGKVAMIGKLVNGTEGDYANVSDALSAVLEENNDWYGLLLASRDQADIEEADGWIPANKLFITQPLESEWTALSGYDLTSLKTGAFPSVNEQEIDAAMMAKMFATNPGTSNWKFQTLSGVGPSGYSNADVSSMLNPGEGEPNMNPVIHEMGTDYTADGKAVEGSFLDIQRAIDWMEARMTENIFQLLISQGKVSYTNAGIAQVIARLKEILQQAVSRDVVLEYTINAPNREDVPTNTRANRVLPDINFEATVSGAVNEVEVHGAVQV